MPEPKDELIQTKEVTPPNLEEPKETPGFGDDQFDEMINYQEEHKSESEHASEKPSDKESEPASDRPSLTLPAEENLEA